MNEFMIAVKKMRRAQRDFSNSKSYLVLQESKKFENQVDTMIQEFEQGKSPESLDNK